MAAYLPPSENVPIFDPILFSTNDDALTFEQASKLFLRYPYAQGTENLQAINVSGAADFGNTIQVAGVSTLNNQVNITTALTNITPSFTITDGPTNKKIGMLSNAGAGAYNPLTTNGDSLIYTSPNNASALTIASQSTTNAGVRITATSSSLNAGSTLAVPTTQVLCDGTNVIVKPNLKYPDNTIQASAYTGAGASAGSYTNTSLTLDSDGKITAISSGSGGGTWTAYTTAGAYTVAVPSTATKIKMYAIGAGGSGGAGLWYGSAVPPGGYYIVGSSGGAGGGISFIETAISSTSVPTIYINVGAGGASVPGSGAPVNGITGGTSYVRTVNSSGAYLISAVGGNGGYPAKITNVYNANANYVANGGYGNIGSGGNSGYPAYFDGVSNMYNAGAGSRSLGQGGAGAGGSGSLAYDGFNWSIRGNAGAGGGSGNAISGNFGPGGGLAGGVGLIGGLPSTLYKRDFIGCPSVGGSGIAIGPSNIPNGQTPTGFWGAGGGGGSSYASNPLPPSFSGGNSGAGADGVVWVMFE